MNYLYFPFSFPPMGLFGSLLCLAVCLTFAYREVTRGRVKRRLPPNPHPQKYAYRSLFIGVILFILAAGALVFTLGIEGYLP